MGNEYQRRQFLKKIAIGSIGLTWMPQLLASPYQQLLKDYTPLNPVRVRGKVSSNSVGVGGVSVSDGLNVVQSSGDGTFELISSGERPFVWMSVPSGFEIPKGTNGVASFYKSIPRGKEEVDIQWDLKKGEISDINHRFLVMADPQTQDAEDMGRYLKETIPDARGIIESSNQPAFNLSCGDIMYDNLEYYKDYRSGIEQLGIPSFQVIGNHDLDFGPTDEGSIITFMSQFGPGYYSFNRGEVHYIVLDNVFWFGTGYMGYIDEIQYKWLENDLQFIEKGSRVVVFTHIPVYDQQYIRDGEFKPGNSVVVTNRDRLYRILEPFKAHIISGHTHRSDSFTDGGVTHHNNGTVCGAWWTGDICYDGTPNGYSIYEVKGSDINWRYKATGKSLDHQMRLYKPGSDPDHLDQMVANVWDARENSEVFWYENGNRAGKMTRGDGLDPMSVRLHGGPSLPAKHQWVEPVITSHLFYAPVSMNAKEIRVEVKDPAGNSYTEILK